MHTKSVGEKLPTAVQLVKVDFPQVRSPPRAEAGCRTAAVMPSKTEKLLYVITAVFLVHLKHISLF